MLLTLIWYWLLEKEPNFQTNFFTSKYLIFKKGAGCFLYWNLYFRMIWKICRLYITFLFLYFKNYRPNILHGSYGMCIKEFPIRYGFTLYLYINSVIDGLFSHWVLGIEYGHTLRLWVIYIKFFVCTYIKASCSPSVGVMMF